MELNYLKNILLIDLGGMGDILLSLPALKGLRHKFSHARISLLITPQVYEVIRNLPYLDEIFLFRKDAKSFFKDLRTLFFLRRQRFDLAVNMRTIVSKSSAQKIKWIMDIIRPAIKMGRNTEGRGYFFDLKVPENHPALKYDLQYYLDIARVLGVETLDEHIALDITPASEAQIRMVLEKSGIEKDDFLIGIHPGGVPPRRWPLKNFAETINEIHKKLPSKFVISGSKNEIKLADKLAKMSKAQIINLAGRLNFNQLLALIKRYNIFISNDTGPMHIAAILKTPLVAIFGPGDLTRYDPRTISDKAMVLYQKTDCAPCDNFACRDLRCLKLISPQEVVSAALTLIGQNRK